MWRDLQLSLRNLLGQGLVLLLVRCPPHFCELDRLLLFGGFRPLKQGCTPLSAGGSQVAGFFPPHTVRSGRRRETSRVWFALGQEPQLGPSVHGVCLPYSEWQGALPLQVD